MNRHTRERRGSEIRSCNPVVPLSPYPSRLASFVPADFVDNQNRLVRHGTNSFLTMALGIRIDLLQDSRADLSCGSTDAGATGTIRSTLSLSISNRTFRNASRRALHRGDQGLVLHGLVQKGRSACFQPLQFAF